MLRTALKPRWVALLLLALLAATVMARLGQWQLHRASENRRADTQAQQEATAAPVPLTSVLGVRQPFTQGMINRHVTVGGTWAPAEQLLVAGQRDRTAGRVGLWVLTPLVLPDGSAVPVVRGWVPSADDPAAAPPAATAVQLTGVLQPGDAAPDTALGAGNGLPAGQVPAVAPVDLVNRWSQPLFTGYVLAEQVSPAPAGAQPTPVQPPVSTDHSLNLQNLSYAFQWWAFSGFAFFFWFRLVRDDHRGQLRDRGRRRDDDGPDGHRRSEDHPAPTSGALS